MDALEDQFINYIRGIKMYQNILQTIKLKRFYINISICLGIFALILIGFQLKTKMMKQTMSII